MKFILIPDSFKGTLSSSQICAVMDEKIKKHLREIDRIVAEENEIYLDDDLGEMGENSRITSEQVEAVVESIE